MLKSARAIRFGLPFKRPDTYRLAPQLEDTFYCKHLLTPITQDTLSEESRGYSFGNARSSVESNDSQVTHSTTPFSA